MSSYMLDANIVLRFLTGEPREMAEESKQLMERADAGEVSLHVTRLVMAEIYWVLNSYYEFSRREIQKVLDRFVRARGIDVEDASLVQEALKLAAEEDVDFVDAVVSERANRDGNTVVTFDETDFEPLPGNWAFPSDVTDRLEHNS